MMYIFPWVRIGTLMGNFREILLYIGIFKTGSNKHDTNTCAYEKSNTWNCSEKWRRHFSNRDAARKEGSRQQTNKAHFTFTKFYFSTTFFLTQNLCMWIHIFKSTQYLRRLRKDGQNVSKAKKEIAQTSLAKGIQEMFQPKRRYRNPMPFWIKLCIKSYESCKFYLFPLTKETKLSKEKIKSNIKLQFQLYWTTLTRQ